MQIHKAIAGCFLFLGLTVFFLQAQAQTDNDAIMMNKYQWCSGLTYDHAQWNTYWEGTYKRSNPNIGNLSTQSVMGMSNYGITNQLNLMVGAPYIWTHATGGTLHGMKGFQDFSLFLKWRPLLLKRGNAALSVYAVGGFSTPLENYVIDFLPLSIGLGSTNLLGRGIVNIKMGTFFLRGSGTYIWRSNVKLDRTSYYTTSLYNTNEVQMPDLATFNGSFGIFRTYLIAELMVDRMVTLGGFDIRKNDAPFVSNRMNSTSLGAHVKYTLPFYTHLALVGSADYVVHGRNVGQAFGFGGGAFFAFYVKNKGGHSPNAQIPKN
jgi:hypothetical protein